MKKIILISLVILLANNTSFAQSNNDSEFLPSKGSFTTSLLLGRGQFANSVFAPNNNLGTIVNQAPTTGVTSGNSNSLVNMIGAEVRYFINSEIAVKLSGGIITSTTPERQNIEPVAGVTPNIDAVDAQERVDLNFSLGGEYHFNKYGERMSPYFGLAIPFYYGKHSRFDPTVSTVGNNVVITDQFGTRTSVLFGIGVQALAGIDYYINKDIYFGIQINPLGYNYTRVDKVSGEGFESSKASTSAFNFLTQPILKIGFKL